MLRPVLHNGDPLSPQGKEKCVDDVRGPIRLRKNPIAPLRLQRNTQAGKKRLYLGRWKTGDGAGEKAAVSGYVGKDLLNGAVIGQITPPLTCDIKLPAHLLVALQQRHGSPFLSSSQRREHARGASPYYDNRSFLSRQ